MVMDDAITEEVTCNDIDAGRKQNSIFVSTGEKKMVPKAGLEPAWLPTRPSNVRVCQFHHFGIVG
jgi:hypothetical protein